MPGLKQTVPYVQVTLPSSTTLAEEEIPQRQLYYKGQAVPNGSMNAKPQQQEAVGTGTVPLAQSNFDSAAFGQSNLIASMTVQNEALATTTQSLVQSTADTTQAAVATANMALVAQSSMLTSQGTQLTAIQTEQSSQSSSLGSIINIIQLIEDATVSLGTSNAWSSDLDLECWNTGEIMQELIIKLMNLHVNMSGRYFKGASFDYIGTVTMTNGDCAPSFPDLTGVSWINQGSMSDLAFLESAAPGFTWVENIIGSGQVGTAIVSERGDSTTATMYLLYRGKPVTLDQIKALWNYTPSSGPPMRNGIDDFISIISLLPIQY